MDKHDITEFPKLTLAVPKSKKLKYTSFEPIEEHGEHGTETVVEPVTTDRNW